MHRAGPGYQGEPLKVPLKGPLDGPLEGPLEGPGSEEGAPSQGHFSKLWAFQEFRYKNPVLIS